MAPNWKRNWIGVALVIRGRRWKRLIEIRGPGQLIRTAPNIRHPQGSIAMNYPFDRKVPLDTVRVLLVLLIRSEK